MMTIESKHRIGTSSASSIPHNAIAILSFDLVVVIVICVSSLASLSGAMPTTYRFQMHLQASKGHFDLTLCLGLKAGSK